MYQNEKWTQKPLFLLMKYANLWRFIHEDGGNDNNSDDLIGIMKMMNIEYLLIVSWIFAAWLTGCQNGCFRRRGWWSCYVKYGGWCVFHCTEGCQVTLSKTFFQKNISQNHFHWFWRMDESTSFHYCSLVFLLYVAEFCCFSILIWKIFLRVLCFPCFPVGRSVRDETKNGCEVDYAFPFSWTTY